MLSVTSIGPAGDRSRVRPHAASVMPVTRPGREQGIPCEHVFVTAQGSPLTRLRRAIAGGDLRAARVAASDLRHVELDEAAGLLVLIAADDPARFDSAAVRFLGRACLERSFLTLADTQLLVACLGQLERSDAEARASFAAALRRLRLEHAARRLGQGA